MANDPRAENRPSGSLRGPINGESRGLLIDVSAGSFQDQKHLDKNERDQVHLKYREVLDKPGRSSVVSSDKSVTLRDGSAGRVAEANPWKRGGAKLRVFSSVKQRTSRLRLTGQDSRAAE